MFSELLFTAVNFIWLILYIQGNSFPKPLSPEEENELLEKSVAGDKDAKDKLVEHNLRLVAHIVKKYYSATKDQDDLISIGTIGLIKAVNTFKNDKKVRLATYASRCIENEILMYLRSQKKLSNEVYIQDPIDTDKEGNALSLMDVVTSADDICDNVYAKMNCDKLIKCIKQLEPRQRDIILLRYGIGGNKVYPQRKVAQILNISRSYVSRIEKKAIENLKSMMEKIK